MAGLWKSVRAPVVLTVMVEFRPRTESAVHAIVNHAGTSAVGAPNYVLLSAAAFVWMMLVGHDALDEHR
jgi:hypothetical protein